LQLRKYEEYLKTKHGVGSSELTSIAKPSEDELLELVEMERDATSHYEDFVETKLTAVPHQVTLP
jgi:hypothetical protein